MLMDHNPSDGSFQLKFLGVGPQRTGTSWLDKVLRSHPRLCLPRDVKETRFFDAYYDKGMDWYAAHFVHHGEDALCGEICPTYFHKKVVIKRISEHYPETKIIISVRDPVSRALSLYRHRMYKGRAKGSLQEVTAKDRQLMDTGRYSQHVPRWRDAFGENNVTVILLDDISSNPEGVLDKLSAFLGVDTIPLPETGREKTGAIKRPRAGWLARAAVRMTDLLRGRRLHKVVEWGKRLGMDGLVFGEGGQEMPTFTPEDKRWLLEEHEPDIVYVEKLLGRDLSKWRQV